MKELEKLLAKYSDLDDEMKFVSISDEIWQIGRLENIKKEVSDETFVFHITVNLIGNWKSNGWHYILAEGNELVPYIYDTLSKLGLDELKNAFEDVLSVFTDLTKNCDEDTHIDIINFLSNPRFKVSNERLNNINKEERKQMSNKFNNAVFKLDEISEKIWGYGTEKNGWKIVTEYITKAK